MLMEEKGISSMEREKSVARMEKERNFARGFHSQHGDRPVGKYTLLVRC